MRPPAVSVITVCRNAKTDLLKTQDSIYSQDFLDFEWIVIDGSSSDGTLDLLNGITDSRVKWISEPDTGIYDAMNKGLRMATGIRVWFLNAGDLFFDSRSLGKVAKAPVAVEVCFGESVVEDSSGTILGTRSEITPHTTPKKLYKAKFKEGMIVSHQAFIPLRKISPMYQNTRYHFSGDLDWMLRILNADKTSRHLGCIARIQRDGATMQNWHRSQWERFLILSRHFGCFPSLISHGKIAFRRLTFAARKGFWR